MIVGEAANRVLGMARKFQELKAAPEGEEIESPAPIDESVGQNAAATGPRPGQRLPQAPDHPTSQARA
jgi:hypothetical protein